MGLFEFLGSILSTKRSLGYLIKSFEVSYNKHKEAFPGYDPHVYLSQAWLAFMQGKGLDVNDPAIQESSLTTTYRIACIPEPDCARALGLFIAYQERPDDFSRYPQFEDEFNRLFKSVADINNSDELDTLYRNIIPQ